MVRLATTPQPEQTPDEPAVRPRRPRRRWWKVPWLLVFCVVFLGSGWFTYKIASATNKIFTENTTGGSPLLQGKKLKDDNGRINILLMGIGGQGHDGPNLTDTIQVLSINPKNHQAAMLSIPRDLYVQVPNSSTKVKINEVHSIGEDQGLKGGGPGLLKEEVSTIIGVPIHYFIRVDFSGFRQAVDAVGGIDINVSQPLYDPYYPAGESTGYTVVNIKAGQQHMNGETALRYARSRETTSDFDRSRRQQEVMLAVRDKALNLQYLTNPAKISQMIDILGDHVKTDLSLGEAEKLAGIVKDIPQGSLNSKVLASGDGGLLYDSIGPGGTFILLPRSGTYTDIQDFAKQLFLGSNAVNEHARIELQNASGRGGLAKLESDTLTTYGYQIVATSNAPQIAQTTIIYDFTNGGRPATTSYLQQRYHGAKVIRQDGPPNGPELRVVIGTDYSTQAQSGTQAGSN